MKLIKVVPWVVSALLLCAQAQAQVYKDPNASIQDRVDDLLSRMTLREKISQMVMDVENTPEKAPSIGAYLIGPSDPPLGDDSLEAWRLRQNQLHAASSNQRLGIPILIAADAVHGQNVLSGATIFPHNIGLGATRNPSLVRKVAQVTAEECMSSALDMAFAPTIAVARTMTWGRTYESYSEDTDTVRSFVAALIEGLQGTSTPWNVIGTAKHWVGDGGTNRGTGTENGNIDRGDTTLLEADLLQIHGAPYIDAIKADVGSIMVSFNSIDGVQMHQHTHLITDVLKGDMGFQGFLVTDWEGYTRNEGDYDNQLRLAINAGIDMLMAPYMAYRVIDSVANSSQYGLIDESRINDAALRILKAKFKAGLFEKKLDPIDLDTYNAIGTPAHRAVARQAVRESLVLLKNDNSVLPQPKASRIFLAGKSADNIRNQCGGWTMSWQGTSNETRHAIVGGTTIREGLESLGTGSVTFVQNGTGADSDQHDVAIVVVGETPYAEFLGDNDDLSLDVEDQTTINNVKASGVSMVLVIVSGRPMIITNEIEDVDAVVAAWLPGTEGDGIAEVFFGDYDFTGTLSFSWPANMDQVFNGFVGDNPNVLFPFGFGLAAPTTSGTIRPTESPLSESSTSDPLKVVTLVMVDNFDDEDNVAEDNWGLWFSSCDGALSNGGSELQYLPGFDGFGARLDYEVDSGEWGLCHLFLDFDDGSTVDLTTLNISGIQFQLQGSEGSIVSLQVGTPLAEHNWIYYKKNLKPTPSWTTVRVTFDELIAENGVPYTLSEALKNAVTLVWEVSDVGQDGWFMIDKVDFTMTARSDDNGDEGNSEDKDNENLSGEDPAEYLGMSRATSLSWALSIIFSLSFGIVQC